MCMGLAQGGVVDKRIGFGLYQCCRNRWSVGCVSVFGFRWCRWRVGILTKAYTICTGFARPL